MKLFTSAIDKQLFAQYNMGNDLENQKVVAKIFNPYGAGTWYLLNSDPNDPDYIWAIVDLIDIEMGSVSRSELESIKVPPFRLPLERDTSFTPINALELYIGLKQGKRYADGGTTDFKPDVEIVENKLGKNYLFPKGSNPNTMGIEFARGGNIKSFRKDEAYRLTPYNSIERSIMERVPNEKEYKLAGNFYIKGHNNDAYIYFLDEFDRDYVKGVDINPNERIYRYITRNSAIGGMMPLIKINVENGLVYYPIFKDEDVLVGFDRRGQKTEYLNLIEADESDYYANGGSTDASEDFIISDGSGMYYSRNLTNGNVKWNDSQDMAYMFSKSEAESIKSKLESEGYSNLSVQKYDKDWWKKMENGGEIKWQDVYKGDSALVILENKLGLVIKPYGRKFHLRFPDGTEKTYDASELKFIKDDEYANGGKTEEGVDLFEDYDDIPENVQMVLDRNSVAFEDGDYRDLKKANEELLKIGYTFEYDLDGQAYDLRKVGQKGKSESYAYGGYMAEGGIISGLTADEAIYLYVKKALVQKAREKYLKPAGLWNTPKSKDVEQSLIKKGFLNNAGAITEVGKNKAREVDSEIGQMISREYISGMNTLAEYRKLVEKFGSADKMAKGGGIGFIPMDLEDKLMITAKWGGTDIQGVIGILNAMIDSGMTDDDLKTKPTKSGSAYQNQIAKKAKEIWAKIKPKYKGDFEGNQYYSTISRLVSRAETDDEILKRYKPFRKYQKDSFADGGMMAKGGMVVTSIKDIPNFKQRLEERKITYRGLGMGKKSDNFYDLAGENGKSIKVDGKEYYITDTEFDSFSRGSDGKLRIRFDAPYKKSYADGGMMADGGVTFSDKVKSIKSSLLNRKKVSPSVQKDYGKTYSPKEAEESAKRIVGAMLKKRQMK